MGLWQLGVESWNTRNNAIYGQNKEEQLIKMTMEVDTGIQDHYNNNQHRVLEEDKSLFQHPAAVCTLQQKQQWFQTVDLAFKQWYQTQSTNKKAKIELGSASLQYGNMVMGATPGLESKRLKINGVLFRHKCNFLLV